jgi:DNA uptake protein ComE-like DNA-binding protein
LIVTAETARTGYDRALFPHWLDVNGTGCTTRQDMLFATVIGFPQVDVFDRCVIVEGDWYSVYDGITHAGQPGDLDVDHVVALAEAWDSGAWAWSDTTRRRFANDPDNLLVVTASSNRSKADRDVGEWRPVRRDAWCLTATITVRVKVRYGLTADEREAQALTDMLATCDEPGTLTTPVPATVVSPAPPVATTPTTSTPTPSASTTTIAGSSRDCIDVNTATETELQAIIHIGPSRAADIVRLRPFQSVADLDRVPGIGASRLQDIVEQGLVCP